MSSAWALGQRALREATRTPDAIIPTLFIPLFFLVVNVGQAGKIFPAASTEFLKGQGYGAFQLPASLLLAGSFGTAALFLVEEIEGGYFDKLRATPIPRTAIVLGRLIAELVKGLLIATALVLLALVFGISVASGPLAIEMPNTSPSSTIRVAIRKPLKSSAISRPSTSAVREIGAERSLSK